MPGLLDFMGLGNMPEGGVGGLLTEARIGSDAVAGAKRNRYDRFAAPPTVASTGGVTPALRPSIATADAPPGSVPQMGMGEAAALQPPAMDTSGPVGMLGAQGIGSDAVASPPAVPAVAPNPLAGPAPLSGGSDPSLSPRPVATTAVPGVNPAAAQPTAGQQPPLQLTPPSQTPAAQVAQSASAGGGGGLLDRVQSFLTRNKNALAGMGAGLAGAPDWGTGISRGMQGNIAGGQLDRQQQGENLTERALIGKGFSPTEAAAAARNPLMLRALLPQAFAQPEFGVVAESPIGKTYGYRDPRTQSIAPAAVMPAQGSRQTINGRAAIFQNGHWYYE